MHLWPRSGARGGSVTRDSHDVREIIVCKATSNQCLIMRIVAVRGHTLGDSRKNLYRATARIPRPRMIWVGLPRSPARHFLQRLEAQAQRRACRPEIEIASILVW